MGGDGLLSTDYEISLSSKVMWGEGQVVPGSPATPTPPCHTMGNQSGACGSPQHLTK